MAVGAAASDKAAGEAAVGATASTTAGGAAVPGKKRSDEAAVPGKQRSFRMYFMGQKFAIHSPSVREEAVQALTDARAEHTEWKAEAWNARARLALSRFRDGIQIGGCRGKAAVGADATLGTPKPTRPAASRAAKRPRVAEAAATDAACSDEFRDKYVVTAPFTILGCGSFGKVYGCHAKLASAVGGGGGGGSDILVAVKVIHKFNDGDGEHGPGISKFVQRELDHLKECTGTSKGLIDLLSWTETTFNVHFVFPRFNEDAFAALSRGAFKAAVGATANDCLPGVMAQLLEGLSVLHSHYIVHRDIKPGNILLDTAAAVERGANTKAAVGATLSDFGSSIKCDKGPEDKGAKVTGSLGTDAGTYQYLAPEVFASGRQCSYAVDIWAMGTSFVHMDTAIMPFGKLRNFHLSEVFLDAVKAVSTWRRPEDFNFGTARKQPDEFLARLCKMQPRPARALPWGKERGFAFQEFTHGFFALDPDRRPSAKMLAAHNYLR